MTYKGTFGQLKPWDVNNVNSFEHPMVPYDVLVDPKSLPQLPGEVDGAKQTMQQVLGDEQDGDEEVGGVLQ